MYSKLLPSKYNMVIGTFAFLFHLGFGEAQFKNENEKAKEMLAFTTALDRPRLWFCWCKTSSSPKSFFITHELMFLMRNLCPVFYSHLFTSSLLRGQFLIRLFIVCVQTDCYIFNEGKAELGECIKCLGHCLKMLKRETGLSEKSVGKTEELLLGHEAFVMEVSCQAAAHSQQDGCSSGDVRPCLQMVFCCHSGVCVGCCWQLVGRWYKCCWMPYNAQDRPPPHNKLPSPECQQCCCWEARDEGP